jgi:hypothetical protein
MFFAFSIFNKFSAFCISNDSVFDRILYYLSISVMLHDKDQIELANISMILKRFIIKYKRLRQN